MDLANLKAYELVNRRTVDDLSSEGYLLRHKKTGARVFLLENEDDNKVFCIGFRTPPTDSTGVPHIMEHSVLCGSQAFPAKDPFVELAKGSLNTFLNAMTYPDKTVYPVASCNDKDFKNLMHVYMDAVFHPNIYSREQIFKQEGWHYEMDSAEGPVTINGVVYNEMKGAYSSAEDVVDRQTYMALYPNTPYAVESGGDPEVIPELTYEAFLDFHRKYYHPSNSYIYLYGKMDMAERLEWLDSEYLSKYDKLEIDSEIPVEEPFKEMKISEISYSVTEDEPLENNTYLSYSVVVDSVLNRELYLAFQILDYALLEAPGAPIKEKLLRAGLGEDVMSTYENGIRQPYFSIMVKKANYEDRFRFVDTIKELLAEIVKNGMDKRALEAGINYFEFKYREADFGSYPKGLMYGLQSFDSWLYDDNDPYMHISATSTIEFLKSKIGTGYFEELIEKYLLNNTHSALVISRPERGLTAKKDAELAEKLAAYKAGLSDEEIRALVEGTAALKKYQQEPSTPEELATIPLLEISDIRKEAESFENEPCEENGVKYVFHPVESNGIGYVGLLFDVKSVPHELITYMSLLKSLLGNLSTERFAYSDLMNEINRNSGGIFPGINMVPKADGSGIARISVTMDGKMLEGKAQFVLDMMEEILFTSKLDEYDRIKDLVLMAKSRLQMIMMSSGHALAGGRATSYYSQAAAFSERIAGYTYYKFIEALAADFDARREEITAKMREVLSYLLCKDMLLIDYSGSREGFEEVKRASAKLISRLSDSKNPEITEKFETVQKNEGFKSASQVQYVALSGDYRKAGLDYVGTLRVLKTIMGYDYLWINVRVKGGAYGCMNSYNRSGTVSLVSYRDPNLRETLEIYKGAVKYLEEFDADERDMTKYIIGTISDMDVPLTPKMRGDRALSMYLSGQTLEQLQAERDDVLTADVAAIRALAPYIKAAVEQNNICVIGAEEKIKENSDLFMNVENLF